MSTFIKKILAKKKGGERGFTLVETLIAIVILTLSIVGPFQIVQSILDSAYNARDELIGTGLAQEGMESVREVRDSNYLNNAKNNKGLNWMAGFDGTGGADCYNNTCMLNPITMTVHQCAVNVCSFGPLYLDKDYVYNQERNGVPTKFTRTVTMTTVPANSPPGTVNETIVTVTVTWVNHGARTVTLTENFRDWL